MSREILLKEYYSNYCDEDIRLIKDNTHKLEFITTTNYIDKYLNSDSKILEIGAGTGRYSIYYAKQGYDVTAIEYVEHNLNILKSKITDDMKIKAELGDAVNLTNLEDNTYDVTLVLGPLYHLYNDLDINKAIEEAIRVTKKDGIIMFAYITSDGVFMDWAIDEHLLDGYPNDFDENFKLKRYEEGIFAPFYIKEFKDIMSNYNVELLHNVATDGISYLLNDKINNLTEEEFEVYKKYHLSTCEREDLQGYSCHMLYICKKTKYIIKVSDNEKVLDFSNIDTEKELHKYLKEELNFPDYYGMNWDAFWDCITRSFDNPERLIIKGWSIFERKLPESAKTLKKLIEKCNKEFPKKGLNITYID